MFSFKLLKGDPEKALADPFNAIITKKFALKVFGNEDVIGKTFSIFNQHNFTITGLMEDIPGNSSLQFDLLLPYKVMLTFFPDFETKWYSSGTHTFIRFTSYLLPAQLEKSFPALIKDHFPDFMQGRSSLGLMKFSDFHTDKNLKTWLAAPVSSIYLFILLGLALVILLIACFNFTNLSISRYTDRIKEIGIRKVIGAGRRQLIFQFLMESLLLSYSGLIFGIILTELLLPQFSSLTGKVISISYKPDLLFPCFLLILGFMIGLISGIYPAITFSSFRPIAAVKGIITIGGGALNIKKLLLSAQLIVTMILIIAVIVTVKQIWFMRTHSLGFDPENIIVFETYASDVQNPENRINKLIERIRNKNLAGIRSVSVSENVPGYYFQNGFATKVFGSQDDFSEMIVTSMDDYFLETYGMQLVSGRNFNALTGDIKYNYVLINESAAKILGLLNPAGQKIIFRHGEGPYEIWGVIKDVHFKTLQNLVEPQIYRYTSNDYRSSFISVSINEGHTAEIRNYLSAVFKEIIPEMPFNYFFITDKYLEGYITENRYSRIIIGFSILSVMLSLLGLFGLTSVEVNRKKRDIGIRKVFGAMTGHIIILFSKEQIRWMLFSFLIACPPAWFLMNRWLRNFPYKTEFSWWIFFLAAGIIASATILTIITGTIRAARQNPADILRDE